MPFIMIRSSNTPVPQYNTSEGFSIRKFKNGQESVWAELKFLAGEFDSKDEALKHFYKEFGTDLEIFKDRCFFIYNNDEAIGTHNNETTSHGKAIFAILSSIMRLPSLIPIAGY